MVRVFFAICLALIATQANADPVTISVLLGAAASTAGAALAGTLIISPLIHFGVTAALGFAMNLLSKSKTQDAQSDKGYEANVAGGVNPHAIIYGECVVGGFTFYEEVVNSGGKLWRLIALAGHECDSITEVYFNDELITLSGSTITAPSKWAGKAKVHTTYLGAASQVAHPTLVSASAGLWTTAHTASGICYVALKFDNDTNAFPNGLPTVTAKVKGAKVYDPRTGLTVWSDNAALCARDYLTADYGLRAPDASIDDTAVTSAANICEESVTLTTRFANHWATSTEDRYTVNGSFTTSNAPKGILSSLCGAMAGHPAYSQGTWKLLPGAYVAAAVSLGEDDLRSGLSITPRHPRADNFNAISGIFRGDETNWKDTSYPKIDSSVFLTEDNDFELIADHDLRFTASSAMAQRIAKVELYRNREQITWSARFSMAAFSVSIGDSIAFTHSTYGWTDKEFQCVNWTFSVDENGMFIDMTLRETSSGVFDWNADENEFVTNNASLPDPWVSAAAGLSVSDELRTINEKVSVVLVVDVTSSTAGFISQFEVQAKKSADSTWTNLGISSGQRFEMFDVSDEDYDVQARTISATGVKSAWTQQLNYPVAAFASAPSDVTNFHINVVAGMAHFTWDAVADLDLSYYIIRHSSLTSGAVFSGAAGVAAKVPRPATSVLLPYRDGTYFIQSVDKTGNASTTPASVTSNITAIEQMNAVQTYTEHSTFSGTKSNLTVAASAMTITTRTAAAPTGTYDFTTVLDLGVKYLSRVTGTVDFTRDDASGALFDSAAGEFDSRAGLFDGATFSDVNVVFQVALTDDDPAASPTWSSWIDFTTGDFAARGLKFRAVLNSLSTDISPKVIALSVQVDMPDRVDAVADTVSGAAAKSITFAPAFKALTGLSITAQGMATGDYYDLTSKSATGFTVHFKDSGGSSISRTFDYIARGYGKEI